MDKIELSKHKKQGDTLYTPFTSPSGLGAKLSLSSWARCWLPEFLWIGLIIRKQGRKKGFENMYHIIEELKDEDITVVNHSLLAIKDFRIIRGTAEKILVNSNTICGEKYIVAFNSGDYFGYK